MQIGLIDVDGHNMVYNKPNAPQEIRDLQRWCNSKIIFKSCPDFADYKPSRLQCGIECKKPVL